MMAADKQDHHGTIFAHGQNRGLKVLFSVWPPIALIMIAAAQMPITGLPARN